MLDSRLESCIYDVVRCNDIHCNNDVHRAQINEMCNTIITNCSREGEDLFGFVFGCCYCLPRPGPSSSQSRFPLSR